MTKAEVHVLPARGGWGFSVEGVRFGSWPQCRALRLALKTARALSTAPDVVAKVVVHDGDGRVRSVLSFGAGRPLRLRRKRRRAIAAEARVPLALAVRYARDAASLEL